MNPNQNPYLGMIQKLRQQQGNATPAPGANPAMMAGALGSQAGANRVPQSDPTGAGPAQTGASPQQVQQGQQAPGGPQGNSAGNTKILIQAIQALHSFTQAAADPQEVAVVRSMIVILNQLIQRDQMAQAQGGQGNPNQPSAFAQASAQRPVTPPTTGAPTGPISGAAPGGPQVGAQFGQTP